MLTGPLHPLWLTVLLLSLSNVFMTFAWYGHLKFKASPLYLVIAASWGIAFIEQGACRVYTDSAPSIQSPLVDTVRQHAHKARNIIAGECRFTYEWRPLPGQDPRRVRARASVAA